MRRKLLLGNWKMNKTPTEAVEFAKEAKELGKLEDEQNSSRS